MTKPVTNSEVEDVLSSIRRLVGDTLHGRQSPDPEYSNDMLVLTPQLRVASQGDVLRLAPEDAIFTSDNFEWQQFEEPPLHVAHADDSDSAENASNGAEPLKLKPEDRLPEIASEPTSTTDFMELSAKIAALETAIAKTVDQWEPDGAGADAYAGTAAPAMVWREGVELDGLGKPVEGTQPPQADEGADAADIVETALEADVIDEHMLRTMVAQIVRSELQGELGERITRNVRKLVRREIHRALVSQSLD
jgi:hypothetical protein